MQLGSLGFVSFPICSALFAPAAKIEGHGHASVARLIGKSPVENGPSHDLPSMSSPALARNDRSSWVPNFVNCADVGMIESRSGPGFAPEAFECLRVMRQFLGQKFQCDMTAETKIFGLVNNTHPAADFFQNAVVRDGLPNHECSRCSGWPYVRALLNASQSLMALRNALVLDEVGKQKVIRLLLTLNARPGPKGESPR